ncbi:ras-related protein Rab-43 isoform X4 [Canis lupus familiaris]|uniref:ras-related protein Rab-43 isoform X4 n=1 Tax=Canis lupus familiaris TaxID=9615 RepID=UPI0018F4D34C|nr:ras-related protein Rab-43 isoform X4 [Canis lupus familiaris]XP_048953605.1 ras-related protein Rab-43 isoform X4 [Canis lupus dingo]
MAGPGPGPGDPDEQYDFLFKLVLVGDASVGKTCVVQRFKTGAFSERQGSTIGVDFTMKTLEIQAADLGHSWPGAIPHHHPELLPQCQRGHPRLRHHQEELLSVCASLD